MTIKDLAPQGPLQALQNCHSVGCTLDLTVVHAGYGLRLRILAFRCSLHQPYKQAPLTAKDASDILNIHIQNFFSL